MIWPVCSCGCLEPVPLATKTHAAKGLVKGQPAQYVSGHGRRHRRAGAYVESAAVRGKRAERSRIWRDRNAEKCRERGATYFQDNREQINRQRRESGSAVKGAATRRARLLGAFIEAVDPLEVLRRHEGMCGICAESVDPADFHVVAPTWTITVEEDETVTVWPSIWWNKDRLDRLAPGWHGYLRRGVWESCA